MNITDVLTGGLILVQIVGAVLTAPTAVFLLWLYRRAAIRAMSRQTLSFRSETQAPTPPTNTPPIESQPEPIFLDQTDSFKNNTSELLFNRLHHSRWQAAIIYLIGGICFAAVMATAQLMTAPFGVTPLRFIVLFWVDIWPAVLVINLVASTDQRSGMFAPAIYFFLLLILTIVGLATSPNLHWWDTILLWTLENLPATLLIMAFLNRRIRAVGPMVFTFMVIAVSGYLFSTLYVGEAFLQAIKTESGPLYTLLDWLLTSLKLGSTTFLFVIFGSSGIFGLLIMAAAGWLILQILRWLYLHQRLSDQSLILDPIWLAFAYWRAAPLVFKNPLWVLTGVAAFFVYKLITWIGLALLTSRRKKEKGPLLLLLRVFALGWRSEQLYASVAKAWRYVGSLCFINGPDLMTSTVEPHNFLDFLTGKLKNYFIDNQGTLEKRFQGMDLSPDSTGRHQVNDFFCYDDTWKMVLEQLALKSNVVLMDLREFSEQHAGCAYEISELINHVPLQQVLFVLDKTSDEQFFRQEFKKYWAQMPPTSPNRQPGPSQVHIFRYTGKGQDEFQQLLSTLATTAC